MFEIPDDDDLFKEASLLFEEASVPKWQQLSSGSDLHKPEEKSIPGDKKDTDNESPQRKRSRILSEVNQMPVGAHVLHTPSFGHPQHNVSKTLSGPAAVNRKDSANDNVTITSLRGTKEVEADPHGHAGRCFPGPAGMLPLSKPLHSAPGTNPDGVASSTENVKVTPVIPSSPTASDVFEDSAWQALVADLQPGAERLLAKFSVRAMLQKARRRLLPKGKVPLLLTIVDSLDFHGSDAGVVVRDPTGRMEGTLHRDVLKDLASDLQVGAAVVLRQVSVISPSPHIHHLNITSANVAVIYPVHNPAEPRLLASPQHVAQGRLLAHIQTAETELVDATNAARERALGRGQGNTAHPAASLFHAPSGSRNTPQSHHANQGRGLFGTLPIHSPASCVSGPHLPQQMLTHSASLAPPSSRFTFKGPSGVSDTASSTRSIAANCGRGGPHNIQSHNKNGCPPVSPMVNASASVRLPAPTSSASLCPSQASRSTPHLLQHRSTSICDSVSTTPAHAFPTPSSRQSDTPQSRWAFKRTIPPTVPSAGVCPAPGTKRTITPSTNHSPGDSAGGMGAGNKASLMPSAVYSQGDGSLCSLQQQGQTVHGVEPTNTSGVAAAVGVKTLWSEELSDDVLSQLSEDF